MAHAHEVLRIKQLYEKMTNGDVRWQEYITSIYETEKSLHGRLPFSQQLIFRVGLELNKSEGNVSVSIWRERPDDPLEMMSDDRIKMRLAYALKVFPEIKDVEFYQSWEDLHQNLGLE